MNKGASLSGIDKAGRIVVPKALRERLHLLPGTEVSIEEVDGHLRIERVDREGRLRRIKGRLVFTGGEPNINLVEALETSRGLRDSELLALMQSDRKRPR
jgi:AbrB family looped-hinge helix DNA binding protein